MSVTRVPAEAREPRPMRADAQRNYARLLDAASAAFVAHGADDVSLEEIARRAGVGPHRARLRRQPRRAHQPSPVHR